MSALNLKAMFTVANQEIFNRSLYRNTGDKLFNLNECDKGTGNTAGDKGYNLLKNTLEDPKVVRAFELWGDTGLNFDPMRHLFGIIRNAPNRLPEEEMVPLATLLAKSEVIKIALNSLAKDEYRKLMETRSGVVETAWKTKPEDKSSLIEALEINDLGRNILGKSYAIDVLHFVEGLANSMSLKELDSAFTNTKLLEDVVFDKYLSEILDKHDADNATPLRALLLKHCNGEPRNGLNNDLSHS
jgi:hypothetical protein